MSATSRRSRPRIAVVGVGPKGLYCLERLAVELADVERRGQRAGGELHLFEPHPFPGAGPVYDPRQPDYLRMNFANRQVDAWSRGEQEEAAGLPFARPTFADWLESREPEAAQPTGYASRRQVGEYLHEAFESVRGFLATRLRVVLHPVRAQRLERRGERWRIETERPAIDADEVVLATGHDSRRRRHRQEIDDDDGPSGPRVPAVFPVDRWLTPERVPPGATAAVRGLGLTAIDAALALTEGRGGRFRQGDRPSRLRYVPSADQVRRLVPWSRTGRPMRPKPDGVEPPADAEQTWHDGLGRLAAAEASPGGFLEVLDTLAEAAARLLAAAGAATGGESDRMRRRLGSLARGRGPTPSGAAWTETATEALEVAFGERPPDDDWALGEAWRNLYPGIVGWIARRPLSAGERGAFDELAQEMERIAFGPPAENAARWLALVRAGIVDPSVTAGPTVRPSPSGLTLSLAGVERSVDLWIDAVLAPPGAGPASPGRAPASPLLRHLLDDGHVRLLDGTCGLEVGADGSCVGRTGALTPGLAAVGRPTEGCVLGNDTLSRSLHEHPARWAQRVAGELLTARAAVA